MPDLHYEHPDLAGIYDLDSGWSVDRDFYLDLASGGPKQILDLGCGTGLLCDAYASLGHDVTGVDPAKAMLDVAKTRPYGPIVNWVEATAQTFKADKKFDLIVMTGHAFQVFLEDADILAVFATMRGHLAENGIIAFETRNPVVDWKGRWEGETELRSDDQAIHQSRIILQQDAKRISFETHYRFPGKTLTSFSKLLFLTRIEIEDRLRRCGLNAKAVFGSWDKQPFDDETSDEMIFIVEAI
ncbi:MAG: class I SAM-dependent methyltransferase [Mesorhizobium sp.]|uniref:class I SAM-dependent DNA methyltransferase n=1 Tax=Mesorhizobium sp. TaxID=1871066 RepID=UPI00122AA687|nr:class I SAM-dependent methyltransferase [Mesorhizobium sp.]TIO54197.1 MAG: class I SAM-dependent methyltransferase [Mesorhizobium sp.]TIO59937.1 MAG: class I SAM-dependent methyltransferase [Mesorhizobium sp.]TJV63712.1 MAG: class I SAM-dependent methyltransferase [Mesorhizobium sp.]